MTGTKAPDEQGRLYTTGDVSDLLGVPISTQKEWERRGYISPSSTPGRHRRYTIDELRRIHQVKYVTERYRFLPYVLEALERGEGAGLPLPWEVVRVPPEKTETDQERADLLDLAARNAELFAEQHKLAKELDTAQQQYRALLDASPDVVISIGTDGRVTYASPSVRPYGTEPEEIIAKTYDELQIVQRQPALGKKIAKVLQGEQGTLSIDVTIDTPSKGAVSFDIRAIPIRESAGMAGVLIVARDMTDRRRAEAAIKESEQLFRTVVEQYTEGISIFSEDGRVIEWNPIQEEITGIKRADVLGRPAWDVICDVIPDQSQANQVRGRIKSSLLASLQTGKSPFFRRPCDRQIRASDGSIRTIQEVLFPMQTFAGYRVCSIIRDVTDARSTEADIRKSEARYRSLFKAVGSAVLVVDVEGRVIEANSEAERIFGCNLETLRSLPGFKPCWKMIREDGSDVPADSLPTTLALRTGRVVRDVSMGVVRDDGSCVLWILINAAPVTDAETGEIMGAVATFVDVTARRRVEYALRASEDKYRKIVETAQEGIWVVDAAGQTTFVNSQMAEMLGYQVAEMLNVPMAGFLAVVSAGDADHSPAVTHNEARWRQDIRFKHKDGRDFWGIVSASPFSDAHGYYAGTLYMVGDITERKWSEKMLEESRAQFRTIFEGAGVGMVLLDSDAAIVLSNDEMQRMLGYGRDELVAAVFTDLLVPEDRPQVSGYLRGAFEGGQARCQLEGRYRRKDGSVLWGRLSMSLIEYGHGNNSFAVGMIEDITERQEALEAIRYLSFHDKLTGLYNRAYFEEELKRLDTSRQLPLSIVMGDVNGLKLVNDAFGHSVGDDLLVAIAGIIQNSCRKEDIISRWGGDEFVILLPGTNEQTALKICSRIRRACEQADCRPIPMSIALGTATKARVDKSAEETLKEAEDRMYRHKLLESKSARSSIIGFLEKTLSAHSYETMEHASRLRKTSSKLGLALGLSSAAMDELNLLAALHDIGKIAIPDEIVMKPGRLNPSEWEIMRTHPEVGYRIAQSAPELAAIAPAILAHHEHWDGGGYPQGLCAEDIPITARIVAIVDAYDAMTNDRPYHDAIDHQSAVHEIIRCAGSQFDPLIVELFVSIMKQETLTTA